MAGVKRRRLTLTEVAHLVIQQDGRCALCREPLGHGPLRDEHLIARELGGGEELANRGIVHKLCAKAKDFGPPTKTSGRGSDITEIARTRKAAERHQAFRARLMAPDKGKAASEPRKGRKMPSRPFPKTQRPMRTVPR